MDLPDITHRADHRRGQFAIELGGTRAAFLEYAWTGDREAAIEYVQVDPALRGRGVGARLVAAAVEWARAEEIRLVPLCSYAAVVFKRTPAYADVLSK